MNHIHGTRRLSVPLTALAAATALAMPHLGHRLPCPAGGPLARRRP